ncbi:MAG: SsrA-binding protein SmpB [Elusimicrobiota bacterium]
MIVAKNRKAYYQYNIIKEYEAGIKLKGPEVKSLRNHRADIKHSFAKIENDELFLINAHISPYKQAGNSDLDPKRKRKLLMKKKQIRALEKETEKKGITLIPTKIYFKRGWAKVSIALAQGKTKSDKRETIKRRITEREMERERKKYI